MTKTNDCPVCKKPMICIRQIPGGVMFVHQVTPYRGKKVTFHEQEGCTVFGELELRRGAGRKKTTGKFETREELVQNVVELVDILGLSYTIVGRKCGVSETTARKLYDEHWAMKAKETRT